MHNEQGDTMGIENAYLLMDYCPIDGKKLETVVPPVDPDDNIKRCIDHPLVLFPSNNVDGEQVMVFDPNRPARA